MHLEVVHSRINIVHQGTITMAFYLPQRSRGFTVAHEHRCRNNGRAEHLLFVTIGTTNIISYKKIYMNVYPLNNIEEQRVNNFVLTVL